MAKAKRDPRTGRFVKKTTARRRTTTKRRAPRKTAARKTTTRRRTYRSNPRRPDLVKMFTNGTMTAAQVLVGKAAARSIPDLTGLPKQGNTGLAIQAGVAVALGYVADMFTTPSTAAAILAGGLPAPLETFLVAQNVPWIGEALSPVTQQAEVENLTGMGRYPGVSSYPRPALVAGYPGPSLGSIRPDDSEAYDYGSGVY